MVRRQGLFVPLSLFLGHRHFVPLRGRNPDFNGGLDRTVIVFGLDDTEMLVVLVTKLNNGVSSPNDPRDNLTTLRINCSSGCCPQQG
jgi:hypothetical protein